MSQILEESSKSLYAVALGGLGEIGLNMMIYHYDDQIVIVDAGIMFPDVHDLGIDIIIQDFDYLREHADKILGVVLTHGHDDHIGALAYLLKEFDLPVYGTKFTLGLVRNRLKEHELSETANIRLVIPGEIITLGSFSFDFIRVNHSIADATSLAITTPVGIVIHTGDFKIDYTPIDNQPIELSKFAQYGEKGVLALFSDSTNSYNEGYTASEKGIGEKFDEIFHRTKGKIIIASFSSNIHRIQQIINASVKHNRKICFVGRSIVENCKIAFELGFLSYPPDQVVDIKRINDYTAQEITLISTGSQGEPMSALSRIAINEHKQVHVEPDDTIIISAKAIPGNEKSIDKLINHFSQSGATIIHEDTAGIHVSGHAYQEELKLMIHLVKPRYFVPLHGEYRHLKQHIDIAQKMGIPAHHTCLARNGDVMKITTDSITLVDQVHTGRVFVDGKRVGEVGPIVIRDRRHLANDGIVMVVIGLDHQSGAIVYGPELITRGFVYEDNASDFLEKTKQVIITLLEETSIELKADEADLKKLIKGRLKKWFNQQTSRFPMILSTIVEF